MKDFERIMIVAIGALLIVLMEAITFGAMVFVCSWIWNTLLAKELQMPLVPFEQALAFGILLGLMYTLLKRLLNRRTSNE